MKPWSRSIPPLLVIALLATPVFAKKTPDPLERQTPVPAGEPIPVIDFFRPRLFHSPGLNPAGTHFAAIVSTENDRLDLFTYNLATKKPRHLTGGGTFDVYGFEWVNDKRLVFSLSHGKRFSEGLFGVELDRLSQSYALQRHNVVEVVGFPLTSPAHAIIWIRNSAKDEGADGGIMKIDTRNAHSPKDNSFSPYDDGLRAEVVETYPSPTGGVPAGYLVERSGELAFGFTLKDGVAALHRLEKGKWMPCPVNLDEVSIVSAGNESGELLALGLRQPGKPRALHRLNAVTGELGEVVFQDEKYDFESVHFYRHPVDKRILGAQYHRSGPQSVWFDDGYKQTQEALDRTFPNNVVRILGSDRAEEQFFVSVSSDVRPASYMHVRPKTKSVTLIADVVPWIDPKRMQPMQLITYKSRDGFVIDGYVTFPAGASKENKAPLVVLPHGGPWVRDSWGWDPEVQFLASRGYAVFQPNYRGSLGTAWRFPESDLWAFRKMHHDVTDGVKKLLKTGLIDADRLAIMGSSFGGYLALCGVADEPDLYRCAIAIAGVFDWALLVEESEGSEGSEYQRGGHGIFKRKLGDPEKMKEKFEEISPIHRVGNVKVPVFVAHGKEDRVATFAQSQALISELRKHRIPHEKQFEGGEGHGFHRLENQVQLYTAVEVFLGKYLAKREPAAGDSRPVAMAAE